MKVQAFNYSMIQYNIENNTFERMLYIDFDIPKEKISEFTAAVAASDPDYHTIVYSITGDWREKTEKEMLNILLEKIKWNYWEKK